MQTYQKNQEGDIPEHNLNLYVSNFKQFQKRKRTKFFTEKRDIDSMKPDVIQFMSKSSLVKWIFHKTKKTISRNIYRAYFEMLLEKSRLELQQDAISLLDEN